MVKNKLLLIKLGGSLITDKAKEFTAKPTVITRLSREIKTAQKQFIGDIIIAHGSGSFGHIAATKHPGLIGLPFVADAAIQINRLVIKQFLSAKLLAVSFSPASLIFSSNRQLKSIHLAPLQQALKIGLLPILYGDIIFDQQNGFGIFSSETTLGILAQKFKSHYQSIDLIYAGDTDGVYDTKGKTLPQITPQSFKVVRNAITGSAKTDVTGGMLHKVEASLNLAKKGYSTLIINGNRPNELSRALLNQKTSGTLIKADER